MEGGHNSSWLVWLLIVFAAGYFLFFYHPNDTNSNYDSSPTSTVEPTEEVPQINLKQQMMEHQLKQQQLQIEEQQQTIDEQNQQMEEQKQKQQEYNNCISRYSKSNGYIEPEDQVHCRMFLN